MERLGGGMMGGMQPTSRDYQSNQPPTISQQIVELKTQVADLRRMLTATANELKTTRDDLKSLSLAHTKLIAVVDQMKVPASIGGSGVCTEPKLYTVREVFDYIKSVDGCVICSLSDVHYALVRKGYASKKNSTFYPIKAGYDAGVFVKNSSHQARITSKGLECLVSYFKGA